MLRKSIATLVFLLIAATLAWSAKTTFIDGDPGTGIKGTRVYAAFLNALNTHYHDGIATDGHGALPYAVASGPDNYTLTLTPAITSYVTGMPIYLTVSSANTGAVSMNINALGVKHVKKDGTQSLVAGDMPAGKQLTLQYDGTYLQLLNPHNILGTAANADTVDGKHVALVTQGTVTMSSAGSAWVTLQPYGHHHYMASVYSIGTPMVEYYSTTALTGVGHWYIQRSTTSGAADRLYLYTPAGAGDIMYYKVYAVE